MNLNLDVKFEETLICCLKNDKNLAKFGPDACKSPKLALSFISII